MSSTGKINIAVVDDDASLCHAMDRLLRAAGFGGVQSRSGAGRCPWTQEGARRRKTQPAHQRNGEANMTTPAQQQPYVHIPDTVSRQAQAFLRTLQDPALKPAFPEPDDLAGWEICRLHGGSFFDK